MSKILKSDLYNYIADKIIAKKREESDEYYSLLDEYTEKTINIPNVLKNVERIQRAYDTLKRNARELSEQVYTGNYHSYREVNFHLDGAKDSIKERFKRSIRHVLTNENRPSEDLNSEEFIKIHDEFRKHADKYSAEMKKLNTLKVELETVVKNATTGKLAHRDLIALGLNMEDFKAAKETLPSIAKLSVDPCIINSEGCK